MSQPAGLSPIDHAQDVVNLEMLEAHDFDMGCDYDDDAWHKSMTHEHGPAKWIARARCMECSYSGTRLICTPCRDLVIATEHGMSCARCGSVTVPARKAFTSFEPLEKR